MIKRACFLGLVFFLSVLQTTEGRFDNLSVTQGDIRLEYAYDATSRVVGYKLFIRKKPGMESVMLTEPGGHFALRDTRWNSVNGNEIRFMYGRQLYDYYSRYSILSSTPVWDSQFGAAFLLYLPTQMVYGNPAVKSGVVSLYDSSFIVNIRSYSVRYADYTGAYKDNFFRIFGFSY